MEVDFTALKALNKHTFLKPIEITDEAYISELTLYNYKVSAEEIEASYFSELDDNKN